MDCLLPPNLLANDIMLLGNFLLSLQLCLRRINNPRYVRDAYHVLRSLSNSPVDRHFHSCLKTGLPSPPPLAVVPAKIGQAITGSNRTSA
jgi:hypothetical protein